MVKNCDTNKSIEREVLMDEQLREEPSGAESSGQEQADTLSESEENAGDNPSHLAAQAREWQDKYLRLSAEFDNYRKRTLKEKMDLISTGGEDVIKSMLEVVDDFDRALEAADKTDNIDSTREGLKLIHHKLKEVLKQKGVSEIESLGMELDTDLHEAVAKFPAEGCQGKIIDVVQKGYKLKDKVIRYAKVVVGE